MCTGAICQERGACLMFIHDMTEAECRYALQHADVGRLACARDNQPYVVPIYFAYADRYLYAVSTVGQKIEWMRTNPLVCVEIDKIDSADEWMSLVVFGRYEELPDIAEFKHVRQQAYEVLQRRSAWWWEPACICENHRDTPHSCTPVAYRILIHRITGQHATPDEIAPITVTAEGKKVKRNLVSGWLARLPHRQIKKRSLP
jgi:uncharacterized protein